MKILILVGASRSVIWFRKELIKFLLLKNCEITVVACDRLFEKEIREFGVEFYCIEGDNRDIGIFRNIKYIKKLSKLIKEISPDKTLTFQIKANTFGVLGASRAKCKDITSMVEGLGSVYNRSGVKNKLIEMVANILYKKAFKKSKTVIFLNQDNRQYMLDKKIVSDTQCLLINGIGVDLTRFCRNNVDNINVIRFVMVARVEIEKGVFEYCEAAKKIIESGVKDVEFNYYGMCDNSINPLDNYKTYVNYRGYTDNIIQALKNNDIMVLPSYHEGLPRSIMEAMAFKMPIITTDATGCKETVEDGVNGWLVAKKSVSDLVKRMLWFVNNKSSIAEMGKASRLLAEKKFDSNKINQQIWERLNG